MNEAILFRGVERLLIVLTAAFFGYLGYRLFCLGRTDAPAKMTFKSKFAQLTFSGTGSGLIFMAFGAIVLLYALIFGGAKSTEFQSGIETKDIKSLHASMAELQEILVHAIDSKQIMQEKRELSNESDRIPSSSREQVLNSSISAMAALKQKEELQNLEVTEKIIKQVKPPTFTEPGK